MEWTICIAPLPEKLIPEPQHFNMYDLIRAMRWMRNASLEDCAFLKFPQTFTSAQMLEAWKDNPDMADPRHCLDLVLPDLLSSGVSFRLEISNA